VANFYIWGRTDAQPARTTKDSCPDGLFIGWSTDVLSYTGTYVCGNLSAGPGGNGYWSATFAFGAAALGQSHVYLGFNFYSDSSTNDLGYAIDDLTITMTSNSTSTQTPTLTPISPTPTPTSTPIPGVSPQSYMPIITSTLRQCTVIKTNDAPDTAQPLAVLNSPCNGTFGADPNNPLENDYYSVQLEAGKTIDVTLTDIPPQGNYDLVLYDQRIIEDPNVNYLRASVTEGQANEQITYTNTTGSAGTYYIRIYRRSLSPAMNVYTLRANIT
jgi:hypothetical protein